MPIECIIVGSKLSLSPYMSMLIILLHLLMALDEDGLFPSRLEDESSGLDLVADLSTFDNQTHNSSLLI